jgi:hypothetical protein
VIHSLASESLAKRPNRSGGRPIQYASTYQMAVGIGENRTLWTSPYDQGPANQVCLMIRTAAMGVR